MTLGCTDCDPDIVGPPQPDDVCPESEKACGHHCDHSWSHDVCCWCGTQWGEGGIVLKAEPEQESTTEREGKMKETQEGIDDLPLFQPPAHGESVIYVNHGPTPELRAFQAVVSIQMPTGILARGVWARGTEQTTDKRREEVTIPWSNVRYQSFQRREGETPIGIAQTAPGYDAVAAAREAYERQQDQGRPPTLLRP